MLTYALRRLLVLIPILFGVLAITFCLMQALPGSPVDQMLGQASTEADRQRLIKAHGLDRPLWEQFGGYVGRLARGDLGKSLSGKDEISLQIASRLPNTVRLATASMVLASLLGIGMGVVCAVWRGQWPDHLCRIMSVFGLSTPVFWFGLLAILFFARTLRWLPPSGDGGGVWILGVLPGWLPGVGIDWRGPLHILLPALTLGVRPAAFIARVTRSQMLETLAADHVRTARAKGLPAWRVVIRHALTNAMIPVVTLIGVDLGSLMAGSVITETIFAYRGLGIYALDGIRNREYSVVMATVLLSSVVFVLVNLAVDLLCAWLDPRVRQSVEEGA